MSWQMLHAEEVHRGQWGPRGESLIRMYGSCMGVWGKAFWLALWFIQLFVDFPEMFGGMGINHGEGSLFVNANFFTFGMENKIYAYHSFDNWKTIWVLQELMAVWVSEYYPGAPRRGKHKVVRLLLAISFNFSFIFDVAVWGWCTEIDGNGHYHLIKHKKVI